MCAGEWLEKKIARVERFASGGSLLKKYNPTDINPDIETKEGLIKMYRSFPGYEEKIREFGIVAIEFE